MIELMHSGGLGGPATAGERIRQVYAVKLHTWYNSTCLSLDKPTDSLPLYSRIVCKSR